MRKIRLVLALLVAAAFSNPFDRETWGKAGAAFRAVFGLLGESEKCSEAETAARNAVCAACPFFFKPLRTCGTPLKQSLRGYGCYCNTEYKNEQRDAECWGDQECGDGFPTGWRSKGL